VNETGIKLGTFGLLDTDDGVATFLNLISNRIPFIGGIETANIPTQNVLITISHR
jgi:hypothetical protein